MTDGLLPCATCPWRVDKGANTIPRYNHELACALRKTVGEGDAFRTIMACHHSQEGQEIACNGYLATVGWTNINVRLLARKGKVPNPDSVANACESAGIQLHETFEEMLAKLSETK